MRIIKNGGYECSTVSRVLLYTFAMSQFCTSVKHRFNEKLVLFMYTFLLTVKYYYVFISSNYSFFIMINRIM